MSDKIGLRGIVSTTLFVSDMDAALTFYVDALGFYITSDDETGVTLAFGPIELFLAVVPAPSWRPRLSLYVEDLEVAMQALSSRGYEPLVARMVTDVGIWADLAEFAAFADPDGNQVFLLFIGVRISEFAHLATHIAVLLVVISFCAS